MGGLKTKAITCIIDHSIESECDEQRDGRTFHFYGRYHLIRIVRSEGDGYRSEFATAIETPMGRSA